MSNIRYYAPTGTTEITLSNGTKLAVNGSGYVTTDAGFAPELQRAGFTAGAEDTLVAVRNPTTNAVEGMGDPVSGAVIPLGGITCEGAGASTSASASVNATAINSALAVTGLITITKPGTYSVSSSLIINDNTELSIGKGVIIQRAAGMNAPLLKNKYEAYLLNNADLSRTASTTVVVADKNHTRTVGETVIVGQCQTAAYNGVVTVTATTADTWSYTSGGSATDTGGASGYYATIIPVRSTVLAANVSGASNFVTVTDATLANKLKPGDDIWVGSTSTDTNFVGQKTVSSVIPGVSFSYASTSASGAPTGNLLFNFNVGITLSGQGQLDGNRANQAAPGAGATLGQRVNTVNMTMVSRLRIVDGLNITGALYRALSCFNCSNILLDMAVKDTLVGVQFEGSVRNLTVERLRGESTFYNTTYSKFQADDFIAFTGTHYVGNATYDNTTSPYGLGNFTNFELVDIEPDNCKNGVKITGYSSVNFQGHIRRVVGGAKNPVLINGGGTTVGASYGVNIQDDPVGGTALVGGNVDKLKIDYVNFHDAYASTSVAGVGVLNTGVNGQIEVGYIDDGADMRALVEVDQNTGSTVYFAALEQKQSYNMATATKPRYLFNSGTVKRIVADGEFIPPTTNGAPSISLKSGFVYSDFFMRGQYGGPSANSGMLISHAATPGKIVFDNFNPDATAYGIHQMVYFTNASAGTLNVYVNNSEISADSFMTDGGQNIGAATFNYYLSGCKWTPGGNNFIQCNASASVHNVYGGTNNVLGSQLYITGSGTQVINFYCEAARIDVTNSARLGKPMGAKAWNTNAALGTLGAAGPVISDGTNWHLMTDTTKLY